MADRLVQVRLSRTTNAGLLRTYATLTHRIHANRKNRDYKLALDLRSQRDVIELEILRRMKGGA